MMLSRCVRRGLVPLASILVLAATVARAADVPIADELIRKATSAMGGEAIAQIESYMSTSEMTAAQGKMAAQTYWMKPKHVLVRRRLAQMGDVEMGTDGVVGWTKTPMSGGYTLLQDAQVDQLVEQVVHMRLLNLRESIREKFELANVTEADFDGAACYGLEFTSKDEDTSRAERGTIFFEVESGLIRGMRTARDGLISAVTLKDWKTIDGVKFFHQMQMTDGRTVTTMTFTAIELNKVDPGLMRVPEQVTALAKLQKDDDAPEMSLEDFSRQAREMIDDMLRGLPWDDARALRTARQGLAGHADRMPGEYGKAMKYVLKKIDARLAELGG